MSGVAYPHFDGTQACAGEDPELFHPTTGARDIEKALEVCGRCDFRAPCGQFALTHDVHGIWGGTTRPTRQEIQRRHGIKPHQLELSDTHTRIEEVRRLTENGLSAAEIADRTGLAKRSATRIRGYKSA